MLIASFVIRTADEARRSIEGLRAAVENSNISTESKSFLIDAATRTMELWRVQLDRPNTKSLSADQVFGGPDYKVVLKARPVGGFLVSLKRMFGV
jgi:hypothetical protein